MAEQPQLNSIRDWIGGGWLLFLLPLPLIPALFVSLLKGAILPALATLAAIALFVLAGISTRYGLVRERDYERKRFATAPRFKLKLFGGLLTAAGTLVCARFLVDEGWVFSLFTGALSMAGHWLSYGLDPVKDKSSAPGNSGYTTQQVVDALREAAEKIEGIRNAARDMKNLELRGRLIRISESAMKIVDAIEEDPRDLRRARKFLNVYLDGAHKVANGYAKTHTHTQSEELESNFRNVLVSIETVFSEQHKKLLENDVLDLDVQIEVLDTQLKHEGVV
ncbi:MAG: 5-bromo-4-chloroindolyl phosphate hydrolase [Gammaproteobacteria bacterium]|nr:5-bromo-4-chloroindolyl phosphate hydrolase [Gammaproteobacteria bacterium]